jgi:MFS family permease
MPGNGEAKPTLATVGAVVIGNALEWYDFALYGFFAGTIGNLFFPSESAWTSLLSSLAVFGSAYFVRPFGGIILAQMADRWGRRNVLVLVIAVMTVGTAMIAFVPSYAAIGLAAPLTIALSRLLQGFAAGGEFASATAYLVEVAPRGRRGFYGAWQIAGQGAAILLSGIAGSLAAHLTAPEHFASWGWRVPFLLGLAIGPVGYYLRVRLAEPQAFIEDRARHAAAPAPLLEALTELKARLAVGLGLVISGSAALYVLFVFMPTYAVRVMGLDQRTAFIAPVVAGLTVAALCPLSGLISDVIGRKPLLVISTAGLLLAPYPCFLWLQHHHSAGMLALIEFGFGLLFAIGGGPFNAALSEMFPVRARATGLAIAYNFGVALFGGLAPFVVVWLIATTRDPLAPSYYVAACGAIGLAAALRWPVPAEEERTGPTAG